MKVNLYLLMVLAVLAFIGLLFQGINLINISL